MRPKTGGGHQRDAVPIFRQTREFPRSGKKELICHSPNNKFFNTPEGGLVNGNLYFFILQIWQHCLYNKSNKFYNKLKIHHIYMKKK